MLELSQCDIKVQGDRTGAHCSGMFTTNITSFGLEALLFFKRKNEMKPFLNVSNIDVCYVLNGGKTSAPIIRLVRDMLDSGGNLPKSCPISNGYKFEFHDLNADPKFFPFLPDMNFLLVLSFALNNIPRSFVVNITGEIESPRKSLIMG